MPELKDIYIRILNYMEENLQDDPVFDWIMRETVTRGVPEIQITSEQGRFLRLMVTLTRARRILEIGTLAGYSTVWMAQALPADGKIITLEANEKHAALARDSFVQAGVADKVEVLVGPAMDTLSRLELDESLDLTFIDADKPNNINYFRWAAAHSKPGALIIIDNVFLNGRAIEPDAGEYMRSVDAFNKFIYSQHNYQTTVLPFFKKEEDNLDAVMVVRLP
ncbi:MAG TPA: O-methyltransferase [Chloroflexi bacterium]|nr:O-methyltransferase [Chloroflexota bacterium]